MRRAAISLMGQLRTFPMSLEQVAKDLRQTSGRERLVVLVVIDL
jgi:hypothetical protein